MNGSEKKKSNEELADEALDKVAGGSGFAELFMCHGCHDPNIEPRIYSSPTGDSLYCDACARDRGLL